MVGPAGIAAVLAALVAAAPAAERETRLQRLLHHDRSAVIIVSHRACWQRASENAIDGIRRCIANGIDMIEVDVRTTSDGVLVLMHDETVDRTTNGMGAVAALTEAQVAALRLRERGGGSGTALTDCRVPTFAQALAAARGKVLMNIDVKAAALDAIIAEIVRARATRDVVLNVPIDVDPATLRSVRTHGIAIQPLYIERRSRLLANAALARAAALRPTAIQLIFDSPGVIEAARAHRSTMRLFVNTMARDIATGTPMGLSGPFLDTRARRDPGAIWGRLIAQGVTMIQTDEPWRLKAWLQTRATRRRAP